MLVDGIVERDLPEMVQERGHLEVAHVGGRQAELLAHRRRQRRDPLGVTGRHEPAELGRHRERFDRLTVRAGRGVEPFERVPGGEQRRGEEQRSPDADAPVAVDAAVADRHQHARRRDRQPREPAPRPRTTRRAGTPCSRVTSTTSCATAAAASATEHRRDLLALADEVPRALVRGEGRGRDRHAHDRRS